MNNITENLSHVLVIDDHWSIIENGISKILESSFSEPIIIISARTTNDAVKQVKKYHSTLKLVIVDLRLPKEIEEIDDLMNGHQLLRNLMKDYPLLNLMVLSGCGASKLAPLKNEINNHQGGFTTASKDSSPDKIRVSIQRSVDGLRYTQDIKSEIMELTDREYQILILLCCGQKNPQIASKLQIAPNTVKEYLKNIYRKMNISGKDCDSRSMAIKKAGEAGYID